MQTLSVDQLVGMTLGEYRIERLLGHGQLGAAYIAEQLSQGRTVMITMFNFPEGSSAQERDQLSSRFAQERAALVGLAHPNILPIYDLGEQFGYLYLVTAFVKGVSLGQVLKQQMRFTPKQTLDVLKQLASGLDYAHSNGVVHGILSLSNVLMSNELTVQIAGFGLRTVLEACGNSQNTQLRASLFSTNGTYLGNAEYISPERVLERPADTRSDIYTLGVMLFELLSGTLPFRGANPLDIALERIEQPVPSLHAVCPDIPEALDLVISKTLECDPAKRYQRAGDSAAAFERVLRVLEAVEKSSTSRGLQLAVEPQLTLPPTINWFDEDALPSGKWQSMPPTITGNVSAISPMSSTHTAWRPQGLHTVPQTASQPHSTTLATTIHEHTSPEHEVLPHPANKHGYSLTGIDPFAWWFDSTTMTPQPEPGTFTRRPERPPVRLASTRGRRQTTQQGRRQVVKLIATSTAVVGAFAEGGISFAYFAQSFKPSQQVANAPAPGSTTTTGGNTPTTGGSTPTTGTTQAPPGSPTASKTQTPAPSLTHTAQPTSTAQPTQQPSSALHPTPTAHPTPHPTQQPTPKPTQQPTQQPTPKPTPSPTPSHSGTVIANTSQPTNSSKGFTNPADSKGSLLIHLSSGFVACESACTHQGVTVNYDPGSGHLVCPAHGAIFDPANAFSVLQGPATSPLPAVSIHVNGDGTITTG